MACWATWQRRWAKTSPPSCPALCRRPSHPAPRCGAALFRSFVSPPNLEEHLRKWPNRVIACPILIELQKQGLGVERTSNSHISETYVETYLKTSANVWTTLVASYISLEDCLEGENGAALLQSQDMPTAPHHACVRTKHPDGLIHGGRHT